MTKEKEDRIERNAFLNFANMYYATIEDNFISAAKIAAKEKYGIELTYQLEKLLEAAYTIGFADAMSLGIDRDDRDEPYGEEPTCKPHATTAR